MKIVIQEESQNKLGVDKDTMPSDAVLASRLKKLIESLPHGLSTWAVNKRAAKAEVSRKLKAEQKAEQRSESLSTCTFQHTFQIQKVLFRIAFKLIRSRSIS